MAASNQILFIDGLFSTTDAARCSSTKPTPSFLEPATGAMQRRVPNRIVPLLVRDVVTHTHARQKVFLGVFFSKLESFMSDCEVPHADWELLLCMLFTFVNRRDGVTPMQNTTLNDISGMCFSMLYQIVGTFHERSLEVVTALRSILERIGCTKAAIEAPPVPQNLQKEGQEEGEESPTAVGEGEEEDDDGTDPLAFMAICGDFARICGVQEGEQKVMDFANEGQTISDVPIFYYTIDCVPLDERGGELTEWDLLNVEQWFNEIALNSSGVPDILPVARQKRKIGGKFLCNRALEELSKMLSRHNPPGTCTLMELIEFLFPYTPEGLLYKRLCGAQLGDPNAGKEPPSVQFTEPVPFAVKTELNLLSILDIASTEVSGVGLVPTVGATNSNNHPNDNVVTQNPPKLSERVVQNLRCWFDYNDFLSTGTVPRDLVVERGESTKIGPLSVDQPTLTSLDKGAVRAPSDEIRYTFEQIVQACYPKEKAEKVKELCDWVSSKQRSHLLTLRRQKENQDRIFIEELKAQQKLPPNSPPPSPDKSAYPTVLELIERLPKRYEGLAREYEFYKQEQAQLCRDAVQSVLVKKHWKQVAANHQAYRKTMNEKQVPLVYTTALPPTVWDHWGFAVKASTFHLDQFLAFPHYRAMVVSMLERLDRADISPSFFLRKPCAHLYLPRILSNAQQVYRDFCVCSRRPPQSGFWEGNQHVHIKTNIPAKSEIKYRLMVEGYNPGVNASICTVLVGYAARFLEEVDKMEKFGWPDGWDRFAIIHKAKGISFATQYYSQDGFVTIDCEARSFSQVGFSVSAWLVDPGYGQRFSIAAKVFHQDNRL